MCGRYQRRSDKQKIAEAFRVGNVEDLYLDLAPTYNAAPQSMLPVIVWDPAGGTRMLQMMFWRFLPPLVSDPKAFKLDTINARGETLLDSKLWRSGFLQSRCLVPVDSFIEWKRIDPKTKLPWAFAMKDDSPFALGGVWRHWRAPDGKTEMDTFAVITTDPNELLADKTGHDRMPVIIKKQDYQRWLEPSDKEHPPIDLLRPFDSDQMRAWRLDRRVNNVRNNEPALWEPSTEEDFPEKPKPARAPRPKSKANDGGQLDMFS
jgi:putative SOS response-associated peptidase YedK